MPNKHSCSRSSRGSGNLVAGFLLIAVGGILLLRKFGFQFPDWLFTWPLIPILLGIFVGIRHGFRDFSWLILIAIGMIFLLDDVFPDLPIRQFAWPVLIIGVGLMMILGPQSSRSKSVAEEKIEQPPVTAFHTAGADSYTSAAPVTPASGPADEVLDIVAIFAGIKKRLYSKTFRGGEVVAVFGGAEINMMQADFANTVELEVVQIFGGTKLIVPAHWEIRSEAFVMLGGIEDKRSHQPVSGPSKVLVLRGTTICGGIEIITYS